MKSSDSSRGVNMVLGSRALHFAGSESFERGSIYSGAFVIHRSDKRIRERSSVDRDLVLRNSSALFSPDETVMEIGRKICQPRWPFSASASESFCVRGFVCTYKYCGHVLGNSSRTLYCDVYKLTMQSMIDNLGTKSEAASARLRRKEITFLLFRGRVKGACMCAASASVISKRASQSHKHRVGAHFETF